MKKAKSSIMKKANVVPFSINVIKKFTPKKNYRENLFMFFFFDKNLFMFCNTLSKRM